jgi:hypothetical protein
MEQQTQTQTVDIAGRTYAVGLWWQIRSGGPVGKKVMMKAAREKAARVASVQGVDYEDFNYVALRAEQYGLGYYDGLLPAKAVSLAAALRPLEKQDAFLGVFCLDESRWWVCGILRDQVLADTDKVCDSKEKALAEADELRRQLETATGLTEVIRESPEASQAYLIPLLLPEEPLTYLPKRERDQRRMRLGIIGVILALALVCGLYWVYSGYQARQETQRNTVRLAEREAKKQDILAHPERYFHAEWRDAPYLVMAGRQCAVALSALPIAANAWKLEKAVCQPGGALRVSWTHTQGASFVALPAGARLVTPQEATESHTLPGLPGRPKPPLTPLLTKDQATAALYDLTQYTTSQLTLQWDSPEQYRLDEETTVQAPWQRGQFTLAHVPVAALLGSDLFGALGYPGAMLVSLSRKNNDVTLKGAIYAATSSR